VLLHGEPHKSELKVVQCDQTSVCAASIMMKWRSTTTVTRAGPSL